MPGCAVHGASAALAGGKAGSVFGIRQGAVMLTRRMADGRRQITAFLFAGDSFGFAADGVHLETAQVLRRTSLCVIPCDAINQDRALRANLHATARAMLGAAWEHQLLLGRMTAFERVRHFVATLWARLERPPEILMPMRVVDIGDYLGLRPETVSRGFARLRREGVIGPWGQDNFLPITDPKRLSGFAAIA